MAIECILNRVVVYRNRTGHELLMSAIQPSRLLLSLGLCCDGQSLAELASPIICSPQRFSTLVFLPPRSSHRSEKSAVSRCLGNLTTGSPSAVVTRYIPHTRSGVNFHFHLRHQTPFEISIPRKPPWFVLASLRSIYSTSCSRAFSLSLRLLPWLSFMASHSLTRPMVSPRRVVTVSSLGPRTRLVSGRPPTSSSWQVITSTWSTSRVSTLSVN
jgi:hypothetical protein